MSNYFTGRDANQGACTHPCRWKYAVVEEKRPGEYLPVYENERGTYIFNSKDLCMIEHIPELMESGIDSFKIEGRMKTALYVATVARTTRSRRSFKESIWRGIRSRFQIALTGSLLPDFSSANLQRKRRYTITTPM